MSFGPWMLKAFGRAGEVQAACAARRSTCSATPTSAAPSASSIREFEALIAEIVARLDAGNHAAAVGLAGIPQKIRGFGHVKERNLKAAKAEEAELLARFRADPQPLPIAAE